MSDESKANSDVVAPHAGRWRKRILVTLAILAGLLLLALAGVGYAGYRYSEKYDGLILPGARIAGVEVGGMERDEAIEKVKAGLASQLDREITVTYKDREWSVSPRDLGARSNARKVVKAALRASDDTSFFEKTKMSLFNDGLSFNREVAITHPRQGTRGFVSGIASAFDREPEDASLDYSSGWVEFVSEKNGRKVRVAATSSALLQALKDEESEVELATKDLIPETTVAEDFSQVLLVRIGENKLYLYEDGEISHDWTVATGLPEFPTPTGEYSVELKRYMPTWVNPAPDTWGANMPVSIAPGPGNPLGVRAINWTAPAIRFHGTTNIASLGHQASHGCVRLSNDDVVQLYDLIEVGAPIVSVQAGTGTTYYDNQTSVVDIETTREQQDRASDKKKKSDSGSG
jgi:lipoprotein-anchoring transpeptidase ErfK/SrfK